MSGYCYFLMMPEPSVTPRLKLVDVMAGLSATTKEFFKQGDCTAVALHNITGGNFAGILNQLENAAKCRGGTSPSLTDVIQVLNYYPGIRAQRVSTITDRYQVRDQSFAALNDTSGQGIFLLVWRGHIESIYKGQISNRSRIFFPEHEEALKGIHSSPLSERQDFLRFLFHREGSNQISLIVMKPTG